MSGFTWRSLGGEPPVGVPVTPQLYGAGRAASAQPDDADLRPLPHRLIRRSSVTCSVTSTEAADAGRLKDGDLVLFSGFGAGTTWASAVAWWGGAPQPTRAGYSSGNAYGRCMTDRGLRAEVELAFDLTPADEFAYNGLRNC